VKRLRTLTLLACGLWGACEPDPEFDGFLWENTFACVPQPGQDCTIRVSVDRSGTLVFRNRGPETTRILPMETLNELARFLLRSDVLPKIKSRAGCSSDRVLDAHQRVEVMLVDMEKIARSLDGCAGEPYTLLADWVSRLQALAMAPP